MKLHKLRKGERGIRESSGVGTVGCKKGNRRRRGNNLKFSSLQKKIGSEHQVEFERNIQKITK